MFNNYEYHDINDIEKMTNATETGYSFSTTMPI